VEDGAGKAIARDNGGVAVLGVEKTTAPLPSLLVPPLRSKQGILVVDKQSGKVRLIDCGSTRCREAILSPPGSKQGLLSPPQLHKHLPEPSENSTRGARGEASGVCAGGGLSRSRGDSGLAGRDISRY